MQTLQFILSPKEAHEAEQKWRVVKRSVDARQRELKVHLTVLVDEKGKPISLTPSLSQGEGERRESRPKRRLSCVTILSSKLRTRARRRYIVRGDGDATLQKPWCPPLILLRTPTAKECFCHSTYANADAGRQRSRPTDTPMRA